MVLLTGPSALAAAPPAIDGYLDEDFWFSNARLWQITSPLMPDNAASFHLGFDEQYLYFGADISDANIQGGHRQRKDETWKDDSVEIYIDFGRGSGAVRTPETFSYHFSVAGGICWMQGMGDTTAASYPNHDYPPEWTTAAQWAVQLKTGSSLNVIGDTDAGYTVEARIPWSEMGRSGPPPADTTFGVLMLNICRPEQQTLNDDRPLSSVPGVDLSDCHMPGLWQRMRYDWTGPLRVRGLVQPLPLWLGTSYDQGRWSRFRFAESDPSGPWLDRQSWLDRLRRMHAMGLNTLVLEHPHPYTGLLALAGFADAAYFPGWQRRRHQDQFTWLINEANRQGIGVYLSTVNICLPPGWAREQGLDELGEDTPLSRNYTRQAVYELFRSYPQLRGLITAAGDEPQECHDFVAGAIGGGLSQWARVAPTMRTGLLGGQINLPTLGLHTRWTEPDAARGILDVCPGAWLVHDLQGEQWFKPMADPRLFRYHGITVGGSVDGNDVQEVILGGPQAASAYLLWSDPQWMQRLSVDLRRRGLRGFLYRSDAADDWLALESLAAHSRYSVEEYLPRQWENRLAQAYGVGDQAGKLLDALRAASAIMPRFLTLVHDRSARFMPQFGLLLAEYLGMPTISGPWNPADAGMALESPGSSAASLARWNADWGEQVVGIATAVDPLPGKPMVRAEDVANDIRARVVKCLGLLSELREIEPDDAGQATALDTLLDRIELNALLGDHLQHKIMAAILWDRYKHRGGRSFDFLKELQLSVESWQRLVPVANRLYSERVRFWQPQMVSPPPWTPRQIRAGYQFVEGHWREMLPIFERELKLLRDWTDTQYRKANLPLWDHVRAAPLDNLTSVHRIDFEIADSPAVFLGGGAERTPQKELVLSDTASLLIDTTRLNEGWQTVLTSNSQELPLNLDAPHEIRLQYRVVQAGDSLEDAFEVGIRPVGGGKAAGIGRTWSAPAQHTGTRIVFVPPQQPGDYELFVAVRGRAVIVIDQIDILRAKDF